MELTLNDPIFEEKKKLSERLYRMGDLISDTRHKIKEVSRKQFWSESYKKSKIDQYEERLSKAQTLAANTEKMLQDVQARVNPLNTKVSFLKSRIRRLQNVIMQQKEEARQEQALIAQNVKESFKSSNPYLVEI